jgi:hypothetical protein
VRRRPGRPTRQNHDKEADEGAPEQGEFGALQWRQQTLRHRIPRRKAHNLGYLHRKQNANHPLAFCVGDERRLRSFRKFRWYTNRPLKRTT